jgi:hypothetical protein
VLHVLLKLLGERRRHQHRLSELHEAHHEQRHEAEREQQEDDDVLDTEGLDQEGEVALAGGFCVGRRFVGRDLRILSDGDRRREASRCGRPRRGEAGGDQQAAQTSWEEVAQTRKDPVSSRASSERRCPTS